MAKEVVAGETVGAIDDDGPEEGEIEDDTSEEDGAEKKFFSSNSTDTTVGVKYYQPPSSSKSESLIVKNKVYTEDKKHQWRNPKRRNYNFYVDHDKPTRESYDRLTKSELTCDHREVNFHDLLKDYRSSKHGNEGNSHEKENRHFAKDARTDASRNRESGVSEPQEDKLKRSRKRKQYKTPPRDRVTSVSSDTDGVKKRKDVRSTRQKRNWKLPSRNRNLKGSTALFAQIRASKLNAAVVSEQQKIQSEEISSEIEISAEVSGLDSGVRPFSSQSAEVRSEESRDGDTKDHGHEKEESKDESSRSCGVRGPPIADRNEDSESKDEDDDVNQLRMIALQSAFRAKYLERKRRGIIVRRQVSRASHEVPEDDIVDSALNLDDTVDLLEAAVEEAASSTASKDSPRSAVENWQPTLFSSLSEVPLPPDDPPVSSLVEDLTPVDMELALTDEEESASPCLNVENSYEEENSEPSRSRTNRYMPKARSIPVTIGGRSQASKPRKRTANSTENTRSNLLEVRTSTSECGTFEGLDSNADNMIDVNMRSMILLDAVGACSSPEVGPMMEEEHTHSDASDMRSELVPFGSNQSCFSGSVAEDEDEEILRARLLVDISRRHRRGNIDSNAVVVEPNESGDTGVVHASAHGTVMTHVARGREPLIEPNDKSNVVFGSANSQRGRGKVPFKRSVERTRRGQLLARVRNRQVSIPSTAQGSLSPFAKSYLSKVTSRGKYQRVNQHGIIGGKKRIDGNLHVTVVGSASKTKSVSAVPQQQDRIVICLGEDSDESDEERQNALPKRFPVGNQTRVPHEKPLDSSVESSELQLISNASCSSHQALIESQSSIANISIDFEKSVDRFLKEVRSNQESSGLPHHPPSRGLQVKGKNTVLKQPNAPGVKVNAKTIGTSQGFKVNAKTSVAPAVPKTNLKGNVVPATRRLAGNGDKMKTAKQIMKGGSGVTPQAVRHLPPPQQEEYRRLKLQISVLEELHKRRKAAEVPAVSSRSEINTPVIGSNPTIARSAPKLVGQTDPLQISNSDGESSVKGSAGSPLDSKKTALSPALETSQNTPCGNDVEDEDVNLMREQLLRSRLQKRMQNDNSGMKSEVLHIHKEGSTLGQGVDLNSLDVPPPFCSQENTLTFAQLNSESVNAADNMQRKVVASNEDIVTRGGEIPEAALRPVVDAAVVGDCAAGMAPTKSDEVVGAVGGSAIPSVSEANADLGECSSTLGNISAGSSEAPVSVAQMPEVVSILDVSQQNCGEEDAEHGGTCDQPEDKSDGKMTASSLIPPRSSSLVSGVAHSQLESGDTRASQLAELEFQLLSERHAALQYLSEVSTLLKKMEIEGAHLRQKEIAAQKLRAELACTESAIAVQKDFLKRLALTISSTHERVTSTRQRCSVLCHACLKLGNQLKVDKRVNGDKCGAYQVPTGGAALVKSQLSRVLWQTKQLKKSGLPFLKGQNFAARATYPLIKRSARRDGSRGVGPWTTLPPNSLESLNISPSCKTSAQPKGLGIASSETSATPISSVPLKKSTCGPSAGLKSKTPITPGAKISDASISVPQSPVLQPAKFVFASSSSVLSSSAVASSESAKGEGPSAEGKRPVSDVVSATKTDSSPDSGVTKAVNSDSSASEIVRPGSGGVEVGKSAQLRDYNSPLEPITNRLPDENSASTPRNSLQPEESVILDPNVILCPYDLMGECQDEECAYQHQRRKGLLKGS